MLVTPAPLLVVVLQSLIKNGAEEEAINKRTEKAFDMLKCRHQQDGGLVSLASHDDDDIYREMVCDRGIRIFVSNRE